MGRNRKPKRKAELDGTFERHPERRAAYENEPKPEGPLGPPPASFDPDMPTGAKLIGIWHELVGQAPPGVLTSADRVHLELACRILHRIRTGNAKSGDYNTARELLGKMAMNPADRPKVQVGVGAPPGAGAEGKDKIDDAFTAIAAETGAIQ